MTLTYKPKSIQVIGFDKYNYDFQFIHAQEINYVLDANGNLVTGDGFYREYNGLNQLIRIRQGNLSNGQILEEFIWHPTEERVLVKDVFSNGVLNYSIYYVNKNYVHIENSSGNYSEKYVYQDGILVAQVTTDGQKQFIHSDHLGSTSLITDSNGNVVENSFTSPFGENIQSIKKSRFSFTGKELDSTNNEYDFHKRRFKPDIGKFTTPDKLFENTFDPQALNHYSYVRNNPYRNIDLNGAKLVPVHSEDGKLFIYEEKIDETRAYVGEVVSVDYGDKAVNEGRAYYYKSGYQKTDYIVRTSSGDQRLSSLIRQYGASKSGSVENQATTEQLISCFGCTFGRKIKGTEGKVVRGVHSNTYN